MAAPPVAAISVYKPGFVIEYRNLPGATRMVRTHGKGGLFPACAESVVFDIKLPSLQVTTGNKALTPPSAQHPGNTPCVHADYPHLQKRSGLRCLECYGGLFTKHLEDVVEIRLGGLNE